MALKIPLAIGLIIAAWLSLTLGSTDLSPLAGFVDYIRGKDTLASMVIIDIRLPRTLLAIGCGAALGIAGAALQGLLRNPLADPSLVGASQGASVGAALAFYYGLGTISSAAIVPIAGLIGAAIALTLVFALAGSSRASLVILAGLAVSTIASSMLAVILNFAPNPYAMQELIFWMLGSVANRDFSYVALLYIGLFIGSMILLSTRKYLYALTLGEDIARSIGVNIKYQSRLVILGCAILVGTAVAVAGNIGFVGLIVPHIMRPLVQYRSDRLLIPSALSGALLVTLSDCFVRIIPVGQELKLGVVTALLGAPLFIWLIIKERKRWL